MSERLQRVVWSEGMLMAPQHFQQQERYHEALLDVRLRWLAPGAFGVVSLALDEVALQSGRVALTSFSGVLPGGEVLRCRADDDELPPARQVADHLTAQRDPLEVFVGLATERAGAPAFARTADAQRRARYLVEARNVGDLLDPTAEASIEFARRNAVLLLGDEARDEHETIKIAEIIRERDGSLRYVTSYIPPCLRIDAAPPLVKGVRQVVNACAAKRAAVVRALRQRDETRVEFAADEVTRYLALHVVSGILPLLTLLLERGDATPSALYALLMQFAGQLSAFDVEDDPSTLPPYRESDLRATFEGLFARLIELLDAAAAAQVVSVALDARVDGMHLARIHDANVLSPGARILLAVQSELADAGVYELVPRVGKVASWAEIPRYLEVASPAASLSACLRPPREVPVRAGKYYFVVDTDCAAWQAVVRERAVAVHLPPPFEPRATSVELLAIPES